jgi:AcrR family transcriptional regulator
MSTEIKRPRGRPRQFDQNLVLDAATGVFWRKGLSATTVDDLTIAMGMNKPSFYRAFGDKEAIYRMTLDRFCGQMEQAMNATLFTENDLTKAMKAFYTAAVGVYTSGEQPLGCLMVSTAVCSAPTHPDVQTDLLNVLKVIDASFERRMENARSAGQLPKSFDCKNRARFGQALLHSLSVRARAGERQQELMGLIDAGVDLLLSRP